MKDQWAATGSVGGAQVRLLSSTVYDRVMGVRRVIFASSIPLASLDYGIFARVLKRQCHEVIVVCSDVYRQRQARQDSVNLIRAIEVGNPSLCAQFLDESAHIFFVNAIEQRHIL